MSRLPIAPCLTPAQATAIVQNLQGCFDVLTLDLKLYMRAIERSSERKLSSGAIFDALHLLAAEQENADALLTFNPRDFAELSGAQRPQILEPPEPPAVTSWKT